MKNKIASFLFYLFAVFGLLTLTITFCLNFLFTEKTKESQDIKNYDNYIPLFVYSEEQYDENLSKVDEISKIVEIIKQNHDVELTNNLDFLIAVDDFLRQKFFHQTAYSDISTNWILKIIDMIFPEYHFSTSMDPYELIKKNHGLCNQQAIVFQEVIKKYGYEYASVGFSISEGKDYFDHFASAAKVGDEWYYFDSNIEPKFDRRDPSLIDKIINGDRKLISSIYPNFYIPLIQEGDILFRDLNQFPAKNGLQFQKLTQFFSNFVWVLLFLLAIISNLFRLRNLA